MKEKRTQREWILGINAAFLIFLTAMMRPVFETNDDLTIMEMVSGAWSIQDAHIVYQNYLLGKIYVLLYSLTKCVPWYGLIQYFFLWLSFSAIVYVIMKRLPKKLALTLSVLVLCFLDMNVILKCSIQRLRVC